MMSASVPHVHPKTFVTIASNNTLLSHQFVNFAPTHVLLVMMKVNVKHVFLHLLSQLLRVNVINVKFLNVLIVIKILPQFVQLV